MLHFYRTAFATLLMSCCLVSQTSAASDADTRAAYQAALKCLIANIEAEGERRDAGDQAGVARYKASGQRAFDGALKLGRMLGFGNPQLNNDLNSLESKELPLMVRDRQYFINAVAECKGLGLMD
jgi:hypothetical protein